MKKQKTLGQIARDKYDDVYGMPRKWSNKYFFGHQKWVIIAEAVAHEVRRRDKKKVKK